ncbi:ABC transporter ATP-binding protein, partial [Stenotrophomonas maltophilia]|uniref:ABC transporter ATP-binding protein n=1 Tax=Stenotrophomonas maltophilia TaxID=40324 RepID=UPI003F6DC6BC
HGRMVEEGSVDDVLRRPQDSYTKALIAAVPGARPLTRPDRKLGAEPLLKAAGLRKTFVTRQGLLRPPRRVAAVHE